MKDAAIFSVIVQLHSQPPFETQAFRPMISSDFTSQATLGEIARWINAVYPGMDVESIRIMPVPGE